MTKQLTKKERYERMIEWRNLKKLHKAARDQVVALQTQVSVLKEDNRAKDERIAQLEAILTTQTLQIEELQTKVFGKQKKHEHDEDDTDAAQKPRTPRPKHSYRRPVPENVTDTEPHPIDTCPDCGSELEDTEKRVYYEEDIVLPGSDKTTPLTTAIKHVVERGYCPTCTRWHSAVPLPTTPVVLGTNVRIYITTCAILIRLSFEQIHTMLAHLYGIQVSDGEIAKILHTEGTTLRPEHTNIIETIRKQHAAHYDETPWHTVAGASGNYAWGMASTTGPEEAFLLGESRGKGVARRLKGDSTHVGITDHYGAYHNLFDHHQLCWTHPHRKFRDLAQSEKLSVSDHERAQEAFDTFRTLYADLRAVLDTPFDAARYAEERIRLRKRFDAFVQEDPCDFRTLARRKAELRRGRDDYFICLLLPDIPCDNNRAERSLRHLVLKRKNSFGSKTLRGAKATEVLLSVMKTVHNKRPQNFFKEIMDIRTKCMALQSSVRGV